MSASSCCLLSAVLSSMSAIKDSEVNPSAKYDDKEFAKWVTTTLLLIFEHLQRAARRYRVYNQVTQHGNENDKRCFDELLKCFGGPPTTPVKREERGDSQATLEAQAMSPFTYSSEQDAASFRSPAKSTASGSSYGSRSTISSMTRRTDFEHFVGGQS